MAQSQKGKDGSGDVASTGSGTGIKLATISHGQYREEVPVAGMSVKTIRGKFAAKFDIDPDAKAIVDGQPVDDATVIKPGQTLVFARVAGEKGNNQAVITDDQVAVTTPGGVAALMPLKDLISQLGDSSIDTRNLILPDGTKAAITSGNMTIMVFEIPPQIHSVKWTTAKDPGSDTKKNYKQRSISLPYIVILAPFQKHPGKGLILHSSPECYFSNSPIKTLEDQISFPALLNCSRHKTNPDGRPLSWICTQYLNYAEVSNVAEENARIRLSMKRLIECLLYTGFNFSSEQNEGDSWYSEFCRKSKDERFINLDKWEEATKTDPTFVMDVDWIPTGKSVKEIIDRMFKIHKAGGAKGADGITFADIERVVVQYQKKKTNLKKKLVKVLSKKLIKKTSKKVTKKVAKKVAKK